MEISVNDWKRYIEKLSAICNVAGQQMLQYIAQYGYSDTTALINYAYALITKYGEGSAELACQMYDAIAEVENIEIDSAEPVESPNYTEIAIAISGALLTSPSGQLVAPTVKRMVKQMGADTTLHNAIRFNALFAWIPMGDTCPYCLQKAAGGWKRASEEILEEGHAQHIHANCNCEYAVKHKDDTSYAAYNPSQYKQILDEASDGSMKDKRNALRRMKYAENKERINEQHRETYAIRTENEEA